MQENVKKNYVDNALLKHLLGSDPEIAQRLFSSNHELRIDFGWPSLLQYLELDTILQSIPSFQHGDKLFTLFLSALSMGKEKEIYFELYDQLFATCLTQVKDLPQINAAFLLESIREKPLLAPVFKDLFSLGLYRCKREFIENPKNIMHDLILYLGWDRMCVCLATLFDYQSDDKKFQQGLVILRDCLLESFVHITKHGRTKPGLFRLIEALFYYEMRKENINRHTEDAWQTLSRSFHLITPKNSLCDVYYVDMAITDVREDEKQIRVFTMDKAETVNSRIALVNYFLQRLSFEDETWPYRLVPPETVFID